MAKHRSLDEQAAWVLSRCYRVGDCLLYPGGTGDEVPRVSWNGRTISAPRVVLMAHQRQPEANSLAIHDSRVCDHKGCCNVEHMRWGSPQENAEEQRLARARKHNELAAETRTGTLHFHAYVAADDYRMGDYAPTSFQIITRKGFRTRSTAATVAKRREPDPTKRMVLACRRPDCKIRDGKPKCRRVS